MAKFSFSKCENRSVKQAQYTFENNHKFFEFVADEIVCFIV